MTTAKRQAAHQRGLDAENQAAAFLRQRGYRILAQRWRSPSGEIDLLASPDADTLVVVEVKARQTVEDGLWSITPAKQRRLTKAALAAWAKSSEFAGLAAPERLNIRFDIIVVTPCHAPLHQMNAWQPE